MDRRAVLSLAVVAISLLMPLSVMDCSNAEEVSETPGYDGIPSRFDMRDVYGSTPVRNQNPTDLCLSFAEAVALEYLVAKNGGDLEWLSPYYLGYHHYDGYGREWSGDRNEVIYRDDVPFHDATGYQWRDFTRLLSWITTVPDSVLPPYTSEEYGSFAFDDPELEMYRVRPTSLKIMSMQDQADDVKGMIISGNAGIISVYFDPDYMSLVDGTVTYNSTTGSSSNHAVALVGWDDDYPKENFWQRPESDGAWLVKESYGTEGRGDGYVWVSYESDLTGMVSFYDCLAGESEDVLYDHCYGGYQYTGYGDNRETIAANVFVSTGDQMLTSVGTMSNSDCIVDYSVQIYTSLSDPNDPTSGTPALPEPQTGTMEFKGACYVNLDTPIHLNEGETFSVVVKYEGDELVSFIVNEYSEGPLFTNYVLPSPGRSFMLYGEEWFDCGAEGVFLQIRAYAETIDDETGGVQPIPMAIIILLVAVVAAFTVRRE